MILYLVSMFLLTTICCGLFCSWESSRLVLFHFQINNPVDYIFVHNLSVSKLLCGGGRHLARECHCSQGVPGGTVTLLQINADFRLSCPEFSISRGMRNLNISRTG